MSNISVTAAPGPFPPTMSQKLVAEFLGTFVMVFFGVGSVVLVGAALPDAPSPASRCPTWWRSGSPSASR